MESIGGQTGSNEVVTQLPDNTAISYNLNLRFNYKLWSAFIFSVNEQDTNLLSEYETPRLRITKGFEMD